MVIEWTHRWLAALVGLLAIATAISAWRHFRNRSVVLASAIAAVLVIGIQAWVGRLVVKGNLDADLVSLHLAISMTVVALLTIVVVATNRPGDEPGMPDHRRTWTIRVGIAAIASFLLLMLGSVVHNLYFAGWPLMENTPLPDLSSAVRAAHYLHRFMAGILGVYLVYLVIVGKRIGLPVREKRLIAAAGIVFLINIGLGGAHVLTKVNSALLVATHLGMAAVVWSLLIAATTMAALALRAPIEHRPLDSQAGR
jgi:cytochrome c oxidase assembly protein subunit 15